MSALCQIKHGVGFGVGKADAAQISHFELQDGLRNALLRFQRIEEAGLNGLGGFCRKHLADDGAAKQTEVIAAAGRLGAKVAYLFDDGPQFAIAAKMRNRMPLTELDQ